MNTQSKYTNRRANIFGKWRGENEERRGEERGRED